MTAMIAVCSLAVDYARVQLVKTELLRAADAAARYAASGLAHDPAAARANAKAAARDNLADGLQVVLQDADIELGKWDAKARVFTPYSGSEQEYANAVRVTAERSAARGNGVPLTFARLLGPSFGRARAQSIVEFTPGVDSEIPVPATSNPWLAGMPKGTIANPGNPHNNPDKAPNNNPQHATSIPLVAGQALAFDSIDGGANNFHTDVRYTPDGNLGWIVNNFGGREHGKSNLTAPINAVVGLFLDDQQPNKAGAAPEDLNFSTEQARDFSTLKPKLRQPFFIGDGRRSDGSVQTFVVPEGATRLFIGTMDGFEWNNNVGGYITTIHRLPTVTTVK
jgi:hypothetical protein